MYAIGLPYFLEKFSKSYIPKVISCFLAISVMNFIAIGSLLLDDVLGGL